MTQKVKSILKFSGFAVVVALFTMWGVRAFNAWQAPPLQLWHTVIPQEMREAELDKADWAAYMQRENELFETVRKEVTDKLPQAAQVPSNRYYAKAAIYPPSFADNWNRSYIMEPQGPIKGAAIFLHGLTDTPYSLRHLARRYTESGFLAIGLRVPAHGTVPAALSDITWEDWMAATRLAVREAKRRAGPDAPLHLVGFSNGGALAVKYAMDALEDPTLTKPQKLILISPMIGVTRFARFAGIAAVPALFPPFAKAAWLGVVPEFNPFKYNSFPVNGARQSHRLTAELQEQLARHARAGTLEAMPPILTFQSVIDYTVSTASIISVLYSRLPQNGSELVLFDINRASVFGPLMRSASEIALSRLLPPFPQRFDLTVVGNRAVYDIRTNTRTIVAGTSVEQVHDLDLVYPQQIFSLSHVALPFPMDDPLYGMAVRAEGPHPYGVNLGGLSLRGERGVLIVNPASLSRTSSNPFFPYLQERVELWLEKSVQAVQHSIKAAPLPQDYEKNADYMQEPEQNLPQDEEM